MRERAGRAIAVPLAVYSAFTLISAVFLAIGGARQVPILESAPGYHVFTGTSGPGYWGVLDNWDGQWFRSIAENGYPVPPPVEGDHLAQSEWAFLPLYPLLMRAVASVTSLPFAVSGGLLSVLFGAAAMVLIYRLVVGRMGRFGAAALVACLCAFPTAGLLQVAYPESLALLLVASALTALRSRRYGLVMLAALGLALTRPIVLPLAAVIVVHGVTRLRSEGRAFALRDRWLVAITAFVTAGLLGLWPLVADLMSGHRNTYLNTLAAWPANTRSDGVLGGWFASILALTPPGIAALCAILFFTLVAVRKGATHWGVELRTWVWVYPLYLIAATRPSPSIIRYLMLSIVPMWPFPELSTTAVLGRFTPYARWLLLAVIVTVELALQFWWTTNVFTFESFDTRVWFP